MGVDVDQEPGLPRHRLRRSLIGPDTINALPEATIDAFEDHGALVRTIDEDVDHARSVLDRLQAVGIDMADVGATLEHQGVGSFTASLDGLLETLEAKRAELARR